MSKILLVDIDTGMQNVIREMLKEHSGQVEIMTSGSVKEVPNIINSVKVNMILVDLKMPDFEDFEFLSLMDNQYPHIPLIVITAFGTPDIESRIRRFKSCLYFEKPVDMGALREKMFEELSLGVGGQIHGIGLSSFLQMSEMEKTTCALRITSDDKVGLLYLLKGELIAADTGLLSGNDAAFEIIGWENAVIEIEKGAVKKKKEITLPLMNILMEALSIKDDKEKEKQDKKDQKNKPAKQKKKSVKADEELDLASDADPEETSSDDSPKSKDGVSAGKGEELLSASQSLRRRRLKIITYATILVVVVSVAGWFAWFDFIKPRIIKKAYDDVLVSIGYQESPEEKYYILEDYAANNPESPFLPNAEKKMEELKGRIRENDYKRAVSGVESLPIDDEYNIKARTLYNEYLEKYPDGPHVEEIKQKMGDIDKILEKKRYEDIKGIPLNQYEKRLNAFNVYIENHPDGRYIDEVNDLKKQQAESHYSVLKEKIATCEKDKDFRPCIDMFTAFIDDYSKSPQLPKVKSLIADMQAKQTMRALKRRIENEGLGIEEARKLYAEELEKNTGKEVKKSILNILATLDQRMKNKDDWAKIYSNSRNTGLDVDKRIRSLEIYMTKDSSKEYRNPAQKLLAVLQKEKQDIIKKEMLERERKKREQERLRKIKKEQERIETEKRKAGSILTAMGKGRYTVNGDGTVSDMETGLMWSILDTHVELRKCLTYDEAKAYVNNLELGGYSDWRLPTAHDLLMLLNTEPGFHETGARRYWTSESYTKGFHDIANIIERSTDDTWKKGGSKLIECCSVRAVRP